jgi:CRP-like cAMP-binding protein
MDGHLAAKSELRRQLHRKAKSLGLTVRACEVIVERCEIVSRRPGARICGAHDCADYVRILIQGAAKIRCRRGDDRPLVVRYAAPGEFVCLPQPKPPARYEVEIVAHDEVTLALLTRAHMLEAIGVMPVGAIGQLTSWAFRNPTRLLFEKVVNLGSPMPARIMSELRDLARRFGRPSESGWVIDVDLTCQDLADLVGGSRARISKIVTALRARGLVDRTGRKFVLTERAVAA